MLGLPVPPTAYQRLLILLSFVAELADVFDAGALTDAVPVLTTDLYLPPFGLLLTLDVSGAPVVSLVLDGVLEQSGDLPSRGALVDALARAPLAVAAGRVELEADGEDGVEGALLAEVGGRAGAKGYKARICSFKPRFVWRKARGFIQSLHSSRETFLNPSRSHLYKLKAISNASAAVVWHAKETLLLNNFGVTTFE